jgi:hypothetical protein
MIDVGQVYDRLNNLINKDKSGKVYQPEQLNNDLQFVLYTYLKVKYGLPEQPNAPQAYEVVQKIVDDIAQLKVWMGGEKPMIMLDGKGRFDKPEDYWHPSRMTYIKNYVDNIPVFRRIDVVSDDEFGSRLASPLMLPTYSNPVACIYNTYVQVYPIDIKYIHFVYLRKPNRPFYDYDIINDQPVFLPVGERHVNNSVQPQGSLSRTVNLEVPDDCMDDIVSLLGADYGIRLKDQFVYQTVENRKTQGQ